ncbi:hypothetical protein CFH85_11085 [Bacillus safensis]|nr:hypothetical protein CFH85_11085 [Bacillus safensis]
MRAGAHEYYIRSAPVLVLPRAAKVFYHAERRQMAKIKIILAICQQFENPLSLDKGFIFIQQLVWLVR